MSLATHRETCGSHEDAANLKSQVPRHGLTPRADGGGSTNNNNDLSAVKGNGNDNGNSNNSGGESSWKNNGARGVQGEQGAGRNYMTWRRQLPDGRIQTITTSCSNGPRGTGLVDPPLGGTSAVPASLW